MSTHSCAQRKTSPWTSEENNNILANQFFPFLTQKIDKLHPKEQINYPIPQIESLKTNEKAKAAHLNR